MSRNVNLKLNKAKEKKDDEFYTQYKDIEEECRHYKEQFKDKVIYLNCDKVNFSNFYFYFKNNMKEFKIKKIILTSIETNKKTEIAIENNDFKEVTIDIENYGDFRSQACLDILKECDIVITNPPFSLFRVFVSTMLEHNKKFLIIGGMPAMGNKDIFRAIFNGNVNLGYNNHELAFLNQNNELKKVSICWYTNLEVNKEMHTFPLVKTYSKEEHPQYDNFNAIEVGRIKNLPLDYDGIMGVPITYLKNKNNKQFQLIGIDRDFVKERFTLNGVKLFSRVMIKRIKNEQ